MRAIDRRLSVDDVHLLLIPDLLEVGDPLRGQLALFKQVVTPLNLGVNGLTSLETARRLARNQYASYLHLQDGKLARALIKTAYDGHGRLELLLGSFGLADL